MVDSAVNQAIANAPGTQPYFVFEYNTSATSNGKFRIFYVSTSGGARKIAFSNVDIYGRQTPNSNRSNGFHIGDPWVTIEDTTNGIMVFGAKLKIRTPELYIQAENFLL